MWMKKLWCVALITSMVSQADGTNYIPGKTILQIKAHGGPSGGYCCDSEKYSESLNKNNSDSTTVFPVTESPKTELLGIETTGIGTPITLVTEATEVEPSIVSVTKAPDIFLPITENHKSISDLLDELIASINDLSYRYDYLSQQKTEVEANISQLEDTQEDIEEVNQLVGSTQSIISMLTGEFALRNSPRILQQEQQNNLNKKNVRNKKDSCVSADDSYLLLMKAVNQSVEELSFNPLNATAASCLKDSMAYAADALREAITPLLEAPWVEIKNDSITQADLIYSEYVLDQYMNVWLPKMEKQISLLLDNYTAQKEDLDKQLNDLDKQKLELEKELAELEILKEISNITHEDISALIADISEEKTEVEGYISQLKTTQESIKMVNELIVLAQSTVSTITGAIILRMAPKIVSRLQNTLNKKNLRNRIDMCVSADDSYLPLMKVLNQSAVELIANPLNATATSCLRESSAYASSALLRATIMLTGPPWLGIKDNSITQDDLIYSQYIMDKFIKVHFPEIENKIRTLLENYTAHKEDLEKQLVDLEKQKLELTENNAVSTTEFPMTEPPITEPLGMETTEFGPLITNPPGAEATALGPLIAPVTKATELGPPITKPPETETTELGTSIAPITEATELGPHITKPPETEATELETFIAPVTEATELGPSIAPVTKTPEFFNITQYNVISQEKEEVENYISQLEATEEDVKKVKELIEITQSIVSQMKGADILRKPQRIFPRLQNILKEKMGNKKDSCVATIDSYLLLVKVLKQSAVELIANPLNATATSCLHDSSTYASNALLQAITMINKPPWLSIKDESITQDDLLYSQYIMDKFIKVQIPEIENKIRTLLMELEHRKLELEKKLADLLKTIIRSLTHLI